MKLYGLLQFLIVCMIIGFTAFKVGALHDDIRHLIQNFSYYEYEHLKDDYKLLHAIPTCFFLVSGVYAIVKAKISLKEPGLGEEVRKKVINRRVGFVFITFLCSAPIISYTSLKTTDFFDKFIHSSGLNE